MKKISLFVLLVAVLFAGCNQTTTKKISDKLQEQDLSYPDGCINRREVAKSESHRDNIITKFYSCDGQKLDGVAEYQIRGEGGAGLYILVENEGDVNKYYLRLIKEKQASQPALYCNKTQKVESAVLSGDNSNPQLTICGQGITPDNPFVWRGSKEGRSFQAQFQNVMPRKVGPVYGLTTPPAKANPR